MPVHDQEERRLIEQVDLAVQELLDGETGSHESADEAVASLVRLAADLRRCPTATYRDRLRSDLQRRAEMKHEAVTPEKKVKFREGFRTVTPYLPARQVEGLIDFVKQAFGAQELGRGGPGSEGGIHAEVRLGNSILMMGGGEAWRGTAMPAALHVYVRDVDAVYQKAVEAGGTSLYPPTDMEYGDREAGIQDLAGNQWFIATHQATGHAPSGLNTVTATLRPAGAPEMLDFLKRAFGAEESEVHQSPDGAIVHAKIRIGSSVVEVSEAHGNWQPLASMFYLYVEDVDQWHRRAVAAGAESIQEPTDQPYGDRVGAVHDSFGHTWYLGTPIQSE